MRKFLENKGWWDGDAEEALKTTQRQVVLDAFRKAETSLKPSLDNLFSDVYDELPWTLVRRHPYIVPP